MTDHNKLREVLEGLDHNNDELFTKKDDLPVLEKINALVGGHEYTRAQLNLIFPNFKRHNADFEGGDLTPFDTDPDDGLPVLLAGDEDEEDPDAPRVITPAHVVEAVDGDFFLLAEAMVLAAQGDRFRSNAVAAGMAQHYQISQGEARAIQDRLDIRHKRRQEVRGE